MTVEQTSAWRDSSQGAGQDSPSASALRVDVYEPCLDQTMGAYVQDGMTTFNVWAPTAKEVTLRLFTRGSDNEQGSVHLGEFSLAPGEEGTWKVQFDRDLSGTYYDYLVGFESGTVMRSGDPWAQASGVNGRRSMVIKAGMADPDGWHNDERVRLNPAQTVIWESHIADLSTHETSGVSAQNRGKYAAWLESNTYATFGEQSVPTALAHIKSLGVNAVQILPMFDFGSVDETQGGYNWGYDPVNYNVPEGSYASNPYDGTVRIRECKAMIQSLHNQGIGVIMDVVYNHMFSPDNWFQRMVPGYFMRYKHNGALSNGSGCGCDMASEQPMMRKYIVDSVVYWANEYHIDGFRFDLMGLIDTDTMNEIRARLDALPGGRSILMYGEPWAAGVSAPQDGAILADKAGLHLLNERIGHFCDSTRDSIKGHVFFHDRMGYVNGDAGLNKQAIEQAVNAWRSNIGSEGVAGQIIQYVSAHDDLTLWDKLCRSMRQDAHDIESAYAAQDLDKVSDLLAANRLAAGLVLTNAGIPFMLSGEEFARTKFGNDDSYDSGAELNALDWQRAYHMRDLVDYYRTLIRIRRSDPRWFDATRTILDTPSAAVAYAIENDWVVVVNPEGEQLSVTLPQELSDSCSWRCVLDSSNTDGNADQVPLVRDDALSVPAVSMRIFQRVPHDIMK